MKTAISELERNLQNVKLLIDIEERVRLYGPDIISMESVESLAPNSLPAWAPLETFTAAPSIAGKDDAESAIQKAKRALMRDICVKTQNIRKSM